MIQFEERSAMQSPRGMVTSPHHLASEAGADVLRAGGSAVDAAIATAAVLGVIYPHMTGMGGDAFWLIHDPLTGKVRYLDGGGRAAANAGIAYFKTRHERGSVQRYIARHIDHPGCCVELVRRP